MNRNKSLFTIATAAVLTASAVLLGPSPAKADPMPFVQFDYTSLDLAYSGSASRELTVEETSSSTATVSLKDGLALVNGPAVILGGAFDLALNAIVGTAAEGYPVVGTFTATDIVTGTPVFDATFTSTRVDVSSAFEGVLTIEGKLRGIDEKPILVNRAVGEDDWVYTGDIGDVAVHRTLQYVRGELFQMTFGVHKATLASLFDGDAQSGGQGFMHGTVHVSSPAAVVLGVVGLAVAVWLARKYGAVRCG